MFSGGPTVAWRGQMPPVAGTAKPFKSAAAASTTLPSKEPEAFLKCCQKTLEHFSDSSRALREALQASGRLGGSNLVIYGPGPGVAMGPGMRLYV